MPRVRSISELEDAIEDLLEELVEKTGADAATFHYYDRPYNRLILPVGVNLLQPRRFKSWLPSMDRVAGRIVKTGEPVIAEDAEHHPDTAGPFVYAEGTKSSAGYPLCATSGRKMGVVFVNYRSPHTFPPEETALLEEWAVRIADAVAGWLSEAPGLEAELSALGGYRREEAALQKIADTTRNVLGSVAVAIWTPEREGGALALTAQSGLREQATQDTRLSLAGLSSVARAFGTKQVARGTVLEDGVFSKEEARAMRLDTTWAFPILSQSRPLGVLCVYPIGYEDLTPDEETLVEVFVDQAAATIESQSSILTLTTLHDMGRGLTFTLTDPEQLMQEIVTSAARVMGADSVAIHQYDPTKNEFHPFEKSIAYGLPPYPPSERPRDEGVSQRIVERGILPIEDIETADPKLFRTPEVVEAGVRAYLGIRLKAGDSVVGVLFLNYNEPRRFSPDDVTIATTFANYAATTIQNSRLYEQSLQRARRIDLVREVAAAVGSARDLDEILQLAVNGLASVFDVKQCAVALLDESGECYEVRSEYCVRGRVSAIGHRIPAKDNPQIDRILETRQPLIVDDVQHDPIMSRVRDIMAERGTLSMIIVPIIIDDEVVGTIGIDAVEQKRHFTEEEAELAQAIANQAAAAIRNARLFEQRSALQGIARDITSELDKDALLQKTLERSLDLLEAEFGSISIFDPTTELLHFRYAVGKPQNRRLKLHEGLIGTAAAMQQSVRVADVSQDGRYVTHVEETQSELDVPLMVADRLVGVLNAESSRLDAFSEEDQRLAEALAAHAAVAFRTAELYAEAQSGLQERINDIKALQDIYALIGVAPAEDMLKRITEEAARLTPAKYTGLWLLDEPARELRFGAMNYRAEAAAQRPPSLPLDETSISGHVMLTGKTYLCDNVKDDPYYTEWYEDTQSELATPLKSGGRVIGILNLESATVQAFTSDHVRLVEALAGAAAVAISNVRLYESLRALNEIGQTLTSGIRLQPDEILELIYEQARRLTGAQDMYIALYDEETNMVHFGLATEHGERVEYESREADMEERGKTEEVIFTGQPILHTTLEESRAWYGQPGHKEFIGRVQSSYLGVPLVAGEEVLGMIALLDWERDYAYDQQDLQVFSSMASQAAIALDNAELYYDVVQRLEVLNEVGQTLTSGIRLRPDEILELIYEQARRLTGAQDMYIALYDEETNMVHFGLATEHGERVEYESREADMEERGKTEEVIFTGQPILHRTLEESRAWYGQPGHKEFIGRVAPSWLGVPMIVGEEVLGMIALYDLERDYAYDQQDLQVFSSMASQAAIALDNASLYSEARGEVIATKELATLGTAIAALQHRINNTFNIIVPNVTRLRKRVDMKDETVVEILDIIERNARYTSSIIERIQEPLREVEIQEVDVNAVLDDVIGMTKEQWGPDIAVEQDLDDSIPLIQAPIGQVTEVFRNLCDNACCAMKGNGHLTIASCLGGGIISVRVQDNGPGIPPQVQERLFEKPVPSKVPGGGAGLGLWLSQLMLQAIGGKATVEKTDSTGTTMLVQMPAPGAEGVRS